MDLADILAEHAVLTCTAANKRQLFDALAEHAARLTGHSQAEIFATLMGREDLGSTGLGNGIAIPHGKLSGLKGVTAIFVRLATPIDFDAVDDEPVDLVMMLLAPVGAGADHLKALSRVARLLRTEEVVEGLRAAADPALLHAILTAPEGAAHAA